MTTLARLLIAALFSAVIAPALAADPVYPTGVRVGLTPMQGLVGAKTFTGFESPDHGVKVLMTELPAAAYAEVESAFKTNPSVVTGVRPEGLETTAGKAFYTVENGKDGANEVRRYSMIVPGGSFSGYVAVEVAKGQESTYDDDSVRKMFASAVVRQQVPMEEQLSTLPFKVTDLGDFKNLRTLAIGSTILLADGEEAAGFEKAPFMVISIIGSAPESADDRSRFAQQAAAQIPGLRNAKLTMSEPIRIDSVSGFETRIDAVSGKDTPVTVVQWLRFGSGGVALRMIGSAPRDDWTKAFPRFRAVRDGLHPR